MSDEDDDVMDLRPRCGGGGGLAASTSSFLSVSDTIEWAPGDADADADEEDDRSRRGSGFWSAMGPMPSEAGGGGGSGGLDGSDSSSRGSAQGTWRWSVLESESFRPLAENKGDEEESSEARRGALMTHWPQAQEDGGGDRRPDLESALLPLGGCESVGGAAATVASAGSYGPTTPKPKAKPAPTPADEDGQAKRRNIHLRRCARAVLVVSSLVALGAGTIYFYRTITENFLPTKFFDGAAGSEEQERRQRVMAQERRRQERIHARRVERAALKRAAEGE